MPPIPVYSIPNRQAFGMEHSISSSSMESYWTNIASSFRGKNILSPSSRSSIRCKKDDDEYDTSKMMMMAYTDDSSLSDNGSDSGIHLGHKSTNSFEAFHSEQRGFYDMIDDRYSHGTATSQLVSNFEVATTDTEDPSQERPPSQIPLSNEDNFKCDDDDDVSDTFSKVNSGSPRSVFASKKSVSRMLKVTTQRLSEVSKVKLE